MRTVSFLRMKSPIPWFGLPRRAFRAARAAVRSSAAGQSLLAALFCLMTGLVSPAAAAGLEQLQTFLSGTTSARGDFTQRVLRASGQTLESTQGVFAFARPGKLRWEVRKPFEQLMVADGERLWFHDVDLNQVTVSRLGNAIASTPAALLFGTDALDKSFELSELGERDGIAWVQALPKGGNAGYSRIAIGMRDGLPVVMEVLDAFDRTSVFGFSNIVRNPALDAGTFRFTPPEGADLIEQR